MAVCSWVRIGRQAGAGDDRRDADETAGAEDRVRAKLAEDAPGLNGTDRQADDVEEGLHRQVAAEFAGLNGAERNAGAFGGRTFDVTVATDPKEVEGQAAAS